MKKKWRYFVEWWESTEPFPGISRGYQFDLATPKPEIAITLILQSDVAREQKGPLKNFSGPQGEVYTD